MTDTRRSPSRLGLLLVLCCAFSLVSCDDDDDAAEETPKSTREKLQSKDPAERREGLEEMERKYGK